MALQFIFGSSGSGKSSYIFRKIVKEAQRDLKRNYYVVVPEQFTMQTQRELVTLQAEHGIMNIDVVSFQRLAYRIFDELGMTRMSVLEDTGKSFLLRKVAEEKEPELKVLAGNMRKMGYINELKSLISELTQYNVSPEDLEEFLAQGSIPAAFAGKLEDVLVVYRGFREELAGRYITAEEVLELFREEAERSELLPGAVLVFDGFTGFTPIQNKVLLRLMELVQDIYVTVTLDDREDPYSYHDMQELFAMSKKTVRQLLDMAALTGTEVKEPVRLGCGDPGRFREAPGIQFLEQNIFRSARRVTALEHEDEIQLLSLPNQRTELRYVAGEIARLVREEHYRYREIAVISGAVEEYGNYVPQIFEEYGIPYFLDTTRIISLHPLIEFVRAALQVMEEQYSCEAVFRYLRCGLSRIPAEDIDALENYVLATGIRGRAKWENRFVLLPQGMTEDELSHLNEVRLRVMEPFLPLHDVFCRRNVTVRERCVALYEFITFHQVEQQMKARQTRYEQEHNFTKAKEYDQIYRIVMDLLDKLADLLGEERMPLEEYRRILDAGFETAKVGVIPSGYDRVLVGDIERSRLDDVKILFMVGVNDGIVPKNDGRGGIISQMEREELARGSIELSPTARERVFIQRFYLYLAMTKPSRRLYLTCARIGGGGEALRPSYLMHMVQGLFEGMQLVYIKEEEVTGALYTPESSIAYLLEGLAPGGDWNEEKEELWQTLVRWYDAEGDQERLELLLEAAVKCHHEEAIPRAVAQALYGTVMTNSVTRLEQYAACACQHFLTYGLGLRERSLFGFYMADMGTIYHQALQNYAVYLERQGLRWDETTEEQQREWAERAMEDAVAEAGNGALADNARNRYQVEKMKRIFQRTVWALTQQISRGSFTPSQFEVSFSFTSELSPQDIALSGEEKMRLTGRIDRIDTYESGDKLYVKIIDYKSGSAGFELLSFYHGLKLQLVVYMNAAMELFSRRYGDKEVVPAGMFYYHLDDPMIEGSGGESEEEIQRQILDRLRLEGVVSTSEEAYRAMDRELSGRSSVIPLTINKDGSVRASDRAVDEEQFDVMRAYAGYRIRESGAAVLGGDTAVRPYRLKDRSSCTYCPYGAVCGFDRKVPGYEMRQLETLEPEEIYRRMKEATEQ